MTSTKHSATHLLHNAGEVSDIHNQVIMLCDLPGDLDNGRFLKGICANHSSRDLQEPHQQIRQLLQEGRHIV